jgi:CheY-like chemotaxis protein
LIGEDIELNLSLGAGVGRVRADPGQIEQVLMNLVVNARDAMPSGGEIKVSTAEVALGQLAEGSAKNLRPGPYVLLSVSDTGKGMDAATTARLFEPFFTTKSEGKGTGLGLSTVLAIVTRSGGGVDVSTEPGRGTNGRVFLPRVDLPLAIEPKAARQAARGAETILLVEDEEAVRRLVRETLKSSGYRVLDAAGSIEARRLLASHAGLIDLLITDVVLPRVSGRQIAAEFRSLRPGMKVLYMSGYDHSAANSDMLQEDVPFLQKPFTPSVLSAKVREVLDDIGRTKRAGS